MSSSLIGGITAGVGALTSIGSAIASAAAGRKAYKRQGKIIDAAERRNEAWYKRNINENATERADAVAALERQREVMAERSRRAAGTAAVMGGSAEAVAAEKAAQNAALGDTVADIALAGAARKDAVEQQYLTKLEAIENARIAREAARAQQTAAAASQLSQTGTQLAEAGLKMI